MTIQTADSEIELHFKRKINMRECLLWLESHSYGKTETWRLG